MMLMTLMKMINMTMIAMSKKLRLCLMTMITMTMFDEADDDLIDKL